MERRNANPQLFRNRPARLRGIQRMELFRKHADG